VGGQRYDFATQFKLLAALTEPDQMKRALRDVLGRNVNQLNEYSLARWIPAVLRRLNRDEELKNELLSDVSPAFSASVQVSFTSLVSRAGGTTEKLRTFAISELARIRSQPTRVVGFDLVSGTHRQFVHVLMELLQ
jgi:hypothetical protein